MKKMLFWKNMTFRNLMNLKNFFNKKSTRILMRVLFYLKETDSILLRNSPSFRQNSLSFL